MSNAAPRFVVFMQSRPDNEKPGRSSEPFWKQLFSDGEFSWAFQMRRGEAESFFAPQEDGSRKLLAEKRKWLESRPDLCVAVTPPGEKLVATIWEMALGWGHVSLPEDGNRDLPQLARQWEPDLLLMDRESMTLAAGCVCLPSSWNLQEAAGKAVHEIHELVPRLNPQIGEKIDRFLKQLQPGKAFCRENWSFTRSAELNYHPALQRRPLDESVTIDELFLRVEHQLFTAVPGGLLMGIRIENCPLADLAADPDVWNAVAEKIRTMPEDVAVYKSMRSAQRAMLREMERFVPRGR